jgi:hypothetical protein
MMKQKQHNKENGCLNPEILWLRLIYRSTLILVSKFKLCYWLTNPMDKNLFEKLMDLQVLKKFPVFYVTRMFITVFTEANHLSISCVRLTHSAPSYPAFLCSCYCFPPMFAKTTQISLFSRVFKQNHVLLPVRLNLANEDGSNVVGVRRL